MKTIADFEQRLSEVRSEIAELEDSTSRYCELGEWRMDGYENEERYEALQELEERLMDKISELEDEGCDE